MTKDELILEKIEEGFDAFSVAYDPQGGVPSLGLGLPGGSRSGGGGIKGGVKNWLAKVVREVVSEELGMGGAGGGDETTRRYMMRDESGENVKF